MLTISGIISDTDPRNIKLAGIHYSDWNHGSIPKDFFKHGVRKRVTRDRKSCTIRINKKTEVLNRSGEPIDIGELHSCSVRVSVKLKKYFIKPDIEGWSLIAHSVEPS